MLPPSGHTVEAQPVISFNKYLSSCDVSGSVLSTGSAAENQMPYPLEHTADNQIGLLDISFFFEREREGGGRTERERGRERIPSRLHAISTEPHVGFDLTTLRLCS